MHPKWLALLALLAAIVLAGCTLRAEEDDEGDSDGGSVSVGDGEDEDNDAPGASVGAIVSLVGVAALARRRLR